MTVNHGEAFVAECWLCGQRKPFGTSQDAAKWANEHLEQKVHVVRVDWSQNAVAIYEVSWYTRS